MLKGLFDSAVKSIRNFEKRNQKIRKEYQKKMSLKETKKGEVNIINIIKETRKSKLLRLQSVSNQRGRY